MTRGTVVGWAPQRDTDSARMRWWVTAGSVLPGARRGQAESRPPRLRMALGPSRCGWREVVRAALVQGDESGNVPYYFCYHLDRTPGQSGRGESALASA
jgi:hypothetical protein